MVIDGFRDGVERQLKALGGGTFELGIQSQDGKNYLRDWTMEEILRRLPYLRRENEKKKFLRIRPKFPHSFIFVDDVMPEKLEKLERYGMAPTAVLESSPRNFQVWLNTGQLIEQRAMTLVAQECARRLEGDRSGASWRHSGGLAGFTNPKEKHRRGDGTYPVVKLHVARHQVFRAAHSIVKEAKAEVERERERMERAIARAASQPRPKNLKTVQDFHADPRYGGDLHAADMAYANYAVMHRLDPEVIRNEIVNGRDLSHKNETPYKFADRTVKKALRDVGRARGGAQSRMRLR